jgi:hypothetical protein
MMGKPPHEHASRYLGRTDERDCRDDRRLREASFEQHRIQMVRERRERTVVEGERDGEPDEDGVSQRGANYRAFSRIATSNRCDGRGCRATRYSDDQEVKWRADGHVQRRKHDERATPSESVE